MEQPTRAGYPVTFSVDLTGTCAASAEYLTVQVAGLGASALPTVVASSCLWAAVVNVSCRWQCPISSFSPFLSLSLCSVACLLPALVVRKLKEFRYYFAFFPAAHTHTLAQMSHTHTHTLACSTLVQIMSAQRKQMLHMHATRHVTSA